MLLHIQKKYFIHFYYLFLQLLKAFKGILNRKTSLEKRGWLFIENN